MKASKEYRVKKSLKNLEYALDILNEYYVSHFTEPSLDEVNKSYEFIKHEMNLLIERNFGSIKKTKSQD